MPQLIAPTTDLHASFLTGLAECQDEGRHLELDRTRLADPAEFCRYVVALRADAERPGVLDRYIVAAGGVLPGESDDAGSVPQTILWWVDGTRYLGRLSIRHHLNADLRRSGGHIGFEVRPGARRRGHATAMLAAALPLAAALGIDPAWVDCDVDNAGSLRVIEKNGGRLAEEREAQLFFRVPTR